MKLDRSLNIAIPIEQHEGPDIYAHCVPIGREIFEQYYKVCAHAYGMMFAITSTIHGPRIAKLALRDAAQLLKQWDDVQANFLAEIYRLTNIVMPDGTGWTTLPYEQARAGNLLTEDDCADLENALVFFTLVSRMELKKDQKKAIESSAWEVQTTSLNCTEFARSLPILTETANIGAKPPVAVPGATLVVPGKPAPAAPDQPAPNAIVDGKPSSIPY